LKCLKRFIHNTSDVAEQYRHKRLKSQLASPAGGQRVQLCAISPLCIFNNIGRFVFRFVFSTGTLLKDFSASFFGSFRFVFGARSFVFNNLSGLFFKKGILFCFLGPKKPEN